MMQERLYCFLSLKVKTKRNKKQVLRELVNSAETRRVIDMFFRGGRFEANDTEQNASLVGNLVTGLSDEDRELLKDLTAEDIIAGLQPDKRPEQPVTRKRGPVVLAKRKEQ